MCVCVRRRCLCVKAFVHKDVCVWKKLLCVKASVYVKASMCKNGSAKERLYVKASVCKSVCVTSSHLTSSPSFLSVPHSLPTTLSPSYSLALAIFVLLHCCRSVSVHMFQCLSSAFILTFWHLASFIFLTISCYISHRYIPLSLSFLHSTYTTYFLHTYYIVFLLTPE